MSDGNWGNCELNYNLFVIEKGNTFIKRKRWILSVFWN
jgi:hypothetical protein